MGFFSKKEQPEIIEEVTPLSNKTLSSLKDSFEEIRNISKDSFFNASQTIGALEIDEEQNMWRSISFDSHVAFRFSEILSVERSEEAVYSTLGKSTGKYAGGSIGISHNNFSGSSSRGTIIQNSSALTKSAHIYMVSVYTTVEKYRNVTIAASTPAEAQTIKETLEARMFSKNTMDIEIQQFSHNIQKNDMAVTKSLTQISTTDEIRKYKELLDDGIITEDEFIAKKKQLLGI